jgi:hypothetical protein
MADLYEDDILLWSERQADLLRRLAATAPATINHTIDWPNIIEEIETVGRNELRAVESDLVQTLARMLKVKAWPQSRDVPHWEAEVRGFLGEAVSNYTPSMRQRINLDKLYHRALRRLPDTMDGVLPLPVPDTCPVTLEALLVEDSPAPTV